MKTEIRQEMEFHLPNTEEAKIIFTNWISTCPKIIHAYYKRVDDELNKG